MKLPSILGAQDRRRLMSLLIGLGLFQAVLTVVGALALSALLSTAADHAFWSAAGVLVCIGVLSILLRAAGRALAETFGLGYVSVCRVRLLKAIVRNGGEGGRHGIAMTRMISDLGSLKGWVGIGIAGGATHSALLLGLLLGAAFFSEVILLSLAVAVLVSVLIAAMVFRPLRRAIRETRSARGQMAGRVGEALLTASTIRNLGGLDREKNRLYRLAGRLGTVSSRRYFWASLLRHGPELGFLTGIGVIGFATINTGTHGWESAASGLLLLSATAGALRGLSQCFDHWLVYEEGRRRLAAALAEAGRRAEPWHPEGALRIEAIRARTDANGKRTSFEIPAGSVTEIDACAEGTALLRTIAGLSRPLAGRIRLIDTENEIRDASRTALAALLVSPEVPLRKGTLGTALQSAMAQEDRPRLLSVGRMCDLWTEEFDADTALAARIPEAGRGLSASVAARIRLARAVLAQPGVLIIDDPVFEIDNVARMALRRVCDAASCTILIAVHGDAAPFPVDRRLMRHGSRYRLVMREEEGMRGCVPLRQVS